MAKFVVVKQAPEKLEKGEFVISPPTFLEQIRQNARKAPRIKQTAINHLREIVNSIAAKYDPDMNVMQLKMFNYEGLPYDSDEDLSAIVVRLLRNEYPAIFDKYLDHQIKARPMNTKLVYYTGDFVTTGPFYANGLDKLDEKDIEEYMTGKPKRKVGRPAVTNEEAQNKAEQNQES